MQQTDVRGESCCICLQSLSVKGLGRQTLPCGHVMHENCIVEMRRYGASGRCPLCREEHAGLTPVQKLVEKAAMLKARCDPDVVRMLEEILQLDPDHFGAKTMLAECYRSGLGVQMDRSRSIHLFREARKQGPADSEEAKEIVGMSLAQEASCLLESGDMEAAECIARQLRQSEDCRGNLLLAQIAIGRHNYREALAFAEEASSSVVTEGNHNDFSYIASICCIMLEENVRHVKVLQEACARGYGWAFVRRGQLCQRTGEHRLAADLLQQGCSAGFGVDASALDRSEAFNAIASLAEMHELGDFVFPQTLLDDARAILDRFPGNLIISSALQLHHAQAAVNQVTVKLLVRVVGLTSPVGVKLNGCLGEVKSCTNHLNQRFAVYIEGVGVKSIREEHLSFVDLRADTSSASDDGFAEQDLDAQMAIESSTRDLEAVRLLESAIARDEANARVSDVARGHGGHDRCTHVVHMQFSRPCQALYDVLVGSAELAPTISILQSKRLSVQSDCGALIFVQPEHYEPVLTAMAGYKFYGRDVICDPELEPFIEKLANSLPKSNKVYPRGSSSIPLGFLLKSKDMDLNVSVSKRIIHIKIPSSLRSGSVTHVGPATV